MGNLSIKGQEVEVLFVLNGQVVQQLTDIKSMTFTQETKTLEEGYLGEKSNRYDEIYEGYSINVDVNNSSPALFTLLAGIKDRAQRRTPGAQINIKATLNFPNGTRARIIAKDVFFDASGIEFGGRDEYGSSSIPGKGSEFRIL